MEDPSQSMDTECSDMDIYGGLDDGLCENTAGKQTECTLQLQEVDTPPTKDHSDPELPSSESIADSNENVLDLIQDEMSLFDELLVAENKKRSEMIQKEKDKLTDLIQENADLKMQNESLKEKVQQLSAENINLKQNITSLYKTSKTEIECRDMLIADKNAKITDLEAELQNVLSQLYPQAAEWHCKTNTSDPKHSNKNDISSNSKSHEPAEGSRKHSRANETKSKNSNKGLHSESKDCGDNTAVPQSCISAAKDEGISAASQQSVPCELEEALTKFETEQAISLNCLKRAFSEYEQKQGSLTSSLKGSVNNFYGEKRRSGNSIQCWVDIKKCNDTNDKVAHSDSNAGSKPEHKELYNSPSVRKDIREENSKTPELRKGSIKNYNRTELKTVYQQRLSAKMTEENNKMCVDEKSEENSEPKHRSFSAAGSKPEPKQVYNSSVRRDPIEESGKTPEPSKNIPMKTYNGIELKTVYQQRLAAKMTQENNNKCVDRESEENSELRSYKKAPLRCVRSARKVYSPLKRRHTASRYDALSKIKKAKSFKPSHQTPEKVHEVMKDDVLDLYRFQGQSVPFAVRRKWGLLNSKNSQTNSGDKMDKQQ